MRATAPVGVRAAGPVRVRAAGPRDLDRAAALASLLFAGHAAEGARFALEPGREGELRGLLEDCLRDPDRALLVAEARGGSPAQPRGGSPAQPEGGSLLGFVAVALRRRPGPFAEGLRG
ncbi:MAG: hypothetical protein ABFS41_08030, partial [Myxococcota bacterium]